jgi:hypothetical protein
MAIDILEEIAGAITEVADCHLRGRRYRMIAAFCEREVLEPALAIGSEVRLTHRRGGPARERATAMLDELRRLKDACESAIAGVHASAPYRVLVDAWNGGRHGDVAAAAPGVFTAVESYPRCPIVYHPIIVATRRAGAEHFITPVACAESIARVAREGIAPARALDLGADEAVQAVALSDGFETLETPIAVAIDPAVVGVPMCRVVPVGDALVYTPLLRVPWHVRVAAAATDEWWAVRPEAYRDYVQELKAELAARRIALTTDPGAASG